MTDTELTTARRRYLRNIESRPPSTWPADVLNAVSTLIELSPPITPSHEYGRPRLLPMVEHLDAELP